MGFSCLVTLSSSSKVVECTPRDQDVTGSRPARYLAYIYLPSSAFFKKPLEAVQYYGFSIKDAFMDVHRISKKSFVILRLFGGIARGFDRSAVVTQRLCTVHIS